MKTSMSNYIRKRISGHADGYPHLPVSLQIISSEEICKGESLFHDNRLIIKKLQITCNKSVTSV